MEVLPLSKVTLKGRFQLSEALSWAGSCLPDVPHNVQTDAASTTLTFRSTLVGTLVVLTLQPGVIEIQSDSLSAITIIKDHISTIATQKKITFEVDASITDASWHRNLDLLDPLIQEQYSIAQKNQLIDGLKELQLQEEDLSFLSEEYRQILRNAETIRA